MRYITIKVSTTEGNAIQPRCHVLPELRDAVHWLDDQKEEIQHTSTELATNPIAFKEKLLRSASPAVLTETHLTAADGRDTLLAIVRASDLGRCLISLKWDAEDQRFWIDETKRLKSAQSTEKNKESYLFDDDGFQIIVS